MPHPRKSTGMSNLRPARQALRDFRPPKVRGTTTLSVSEFCQRYINHSETEHRKGTATRIQYATRRFLDFCGSTLLADINAETIERYKQHRTRRVRRTTVNIELRHLQAMFQCAVNWDLIAKNSMREVKQLDLPKASPAYVSRDEFQLLWKVLSCQWHREITASAILTGSRREEFLALTCEDISIEERVIRVRHGKGDNERFVPMNEQTAEVLSNMTGETPRLFPHQKNTVSQILHDARIRPGLDPALHFHNPRHYAELGIRGIHLRRGR